MAHSGALVEALKRELRARRINYAAVAKHLALSEVTVKRMFSRNEFTLARLDKVCALAGLEFSDLARGVASDAAVISQLSYEQEKEFVADPRLMLVGLGALNRWSFERIVKTYEISEAECVQLLARLDRLKFIELLPRNRIRLLVSRAFAWIPDGPIQRLFKEMLQRDFFHCAFSGKNELLLLVNGYLGSASIAALLAGLKRIAADFAEMRIDDAQLPPGERSALTLVIAARPWEPAIFGRLRRERPAGSPRKP